MPLMNIFDVAGSGMSAQTVRLNTVASNMANANSASSSLEGTYRARHPVFATLVDEFGNRPESAGVEIKGIVESTVPMERRHAPGHPMADEKGYIFLPNVNPIHEMADMMSAARAYRNNVQMMQTSRQLLLDTLKIGQ